MSDTEKKKPEIVELTEQEKVSFKLTQERLDAAQNLVMLRSTEMQLLSERAVKRVEENGKFKVLDIDPAKGITRVEI